MQSQCYCGFWFRKAGTRSVNSLCNKLLLGTIFHSLDIAGDMSLASLPQSDTHDLWFLPRTQMEFLKGELMKLTFKISRSFNFYASSLSFSFPAFSRYLCVSVCARSSSSFTPDCCIYSYTALCTNTHTHWRAHTPALFLMFHVFIHGKRLMPITGSIWS